MSAGRSLIQNNRGQLLVQVIIAGGIAMIIFIAMLAMQTSQSKENKALSEKLGSLDAGRIITGTISNSANCTSLFTTANLVGGSNSVLTFDSTLTSVSNPYSVPLIKVLGGNPSSPAAAVGELASAFTQSLIVQSISVSVTSPVSGDLIITFDNSKLVRPIKSLTFPLFLTSSGPTASKLITACSGGAAPAPAPGPAPGPAATGGITNYTFGQRAGAGTVALGWYTMCAINGFNYTRSGTDIFSTIIYSGPTPDALGRRDWYSVLQTDTTPAPPGILVRYICFDIL